MEDYKTKYEKLHKFVNDLYLHMSDYCKKKVEGYFPEFKESEDEEKPNGGIVLEDFNEGEGFYKVNLAYLNMDFEKVYKSYMKSRKDDISGNAVTINMKDLARHFYELGLKAKQTSEEIKIGETKIYLNDDGGEPPYDGKQWLDLSCTEYEIPEDKFKDGDNVELIIRKVHKGE